MAAPSLVLFALHNSIESRGFENLCVDLLVREGHSRIVPGGKSRDQGRDAEVRYWVDSRRGSPRIAFQFSMEKRWESKLRRDIAKILGKCDTIERIVFVSSRSISVEKQDKLRQESSDSSGIGLEILDENWFRVRLEEEHVDLAKKHLGVTVEATPSFYAAQVKLYGLTEENEKEMLRHTSPETLLATLTAQAKADTENASAWKGLAHVRYYLHYYDDALVAVERALNLSEDELERFNLTALKASVIAEQGIKSGSRLLLRKAKTLFEPFIDRLGRSIDHYNLANILGALDDTSTAEAHYRRCLELDSDFAQAWKNLGSLLFGMGRADEGMECLDRSLELKPDLLEALCTKANVLVMTSGKSAEALALMERAFEIDPDLELRWPHAHYWYAYALCQESRLEDAFAVVGDRLERKFDCPYLGRLAGDILAELWRSSPDYLHKAEEYFTLRVDSKERDYRALAEMLDILLNTDREPQAWRLLDQFFELEELSVHLIAKRIPIAFPDLIESFASNEHYRRFRDSSPLVDYTGILDQYKLRPHDDVPEILFHLLMLAYFKVAVVFQESSLAMDDEKEIDTLLDAYRLISSIFAAIGGPLMTPVVPVGSEAQSEFLAGAVIAGQDIPLMEISRLLGYLCGTAGREVPKVYQDSIVEETASIHEAWIAKFLEAVGSDWKIEAWRD